jgi:hypothetical protein
VSSLIAISYAFLNQFAFISKGPFSCKSKAAFALSSYLNAGS